MSPSSSAIIFHMNEQERGLCPTGPPSNMLKMGLYLLLHFFPFSWGEADEERDEWRWDWKREGLDSLFRAPRSVRGIPLTGCSENTNNGSWAPDARPHSHTPTRAPSLIITQPAPRDKTSTKTGPLTVLDRGQGTPKVFLFHILQFLSSLAYVCFPCLNEHVLWIYLTFGPSHERGDVRVSGWFRWI